MSYCRFELIRRIRFIYQPTLRTRDESAEFRWKVIEDFVNAIKDHLKDHFTPSETTCVDEWIVCWYEVGSNLLGVGLSIRGHGQNNREGM